LPIVLRRAGGGARKACGWASGRMSCRGRPSCPSILQPAARLFSRLSCPPDFPHQVVGYFWIFAVNLAPGVLDSGCDRLWERCRKSRRCSRDTFPESYTTKNNSIRRKEKRGHGKDEELCFTGSRTLLSYHTTKRRDLNCPFLMRRGRGNISNNISHKVFLKSSCKSQLPHKSVDSSLTTTNIKNKLTALRGNRLLQNDL
jgi:hypothetical protein